MVIWRQRSFSNGKLNTDLALGTAGGTDELEGPDSGRVVLIGQVLEWDPESAD